MPFHLLFDFGARFLLFTLRPHYSQKSYKESGFKGRDISRKIIERTAPASKNRKPGLPRQGERENIGVNSPAMLNQFGLIFVHDRDYEPFSSK